MAEAFGEGAAELPADVFVDGSGEAAMTATTGTTMRDDREHDDAELEWPKAANALLDVGHVIPIPR